MATRQDVETAIGTINDKGNNTAKEVRDVFTSLLDYTENDEVQEGIAHFEANNNKKAVNFDNIASLQYSFRGFNRFTVNFTLKLIIKKPFDGELKFKLEDGLFPILREIIAVDKISFVVPASQVINTTAAAANILDVGSNIMTVLLERPNFLVLTFANPNRLTKGSIVFTSIQLHVPAFFKQ